MPRTLALPLAVYAPHVLEEHLERMADDPLIVAAFGPLSGLPARHSSYLVFQVMLVAAMAAALLVDLGGRWRDAVLAVVGLALLGEAHHAARALATLTPNPGLVTSLPMPLVGVLVLRAVWARRAQLEKESPRCFTT